MEKDKKRKFVFLSDSATKHYYPYHDVNPDDLEFGSEEDFTYDERLEKARKKLKFKSAIDYEEYDQNLKK